MRASGGFTLVEVVIALTLISFVMLGLVGALRTFADSGARLDERSRQVDELRLVPRFLAQVVPTASSRARAGAPPLEPTWFRGGRHDLEFLGVMPARHGPGGYSHFQLGLQASPSGHALVIRILPFGDDGAEPAWDRAVTEVLADNVLELAFSYRSFNGDGWESDWMGRTGLPGWVSLSVLTRQGPWPLMVFRVSEGRFSGG